MLCRCSVVSALSTDVVRGIPFTIVKLVISLYSVDPLVQARF